MDPVTQVCGRFADDVVAQSAADALNRWFRWITEGSHAPVPEIFEELGVKTSAWAWSLEDECDWALGPHARAVGADVKIDLETHDTHLRLAGLLRALGGLSAKIER